MAMYAESDNYVLGRGKLFFDRFLTGTTTKTGERFIGNCSAFAFTVSTENLDHYSSKTGTREKDKSVALQTTRSGSLTTDNVSSDNLAAALLGSSSVVTNTAATVTDEPINGGNGVTQGMYYQLGVSAGNPTGYTDLAQVTTGSVNVTVKVSASTKTEGTDYDVDLSKGLIRIIPGGGIADNAVVTVTYKTQARSRKRTISGTVSQEGALRFITDNPAGNNQVFYMPDVKVTPNGDINLISEQDWLSIQLNLEILKLGSLEAIYCDGVPY